MADFFGNGFWPVRYFPTGYWGIEGEAAPGAMYAAMFGTSSVAGTLTSATTPALPVDYITGGAGFFRSPLRAAFIYAVNRTIPAPIAADIISSSHLQAEITATANASSALQGRSKLAAHGIIRIGRKAHNNAFWLLAA